MFQLFLSKTTLESIDTDSFQIFYLFVFKYHSLLLIIVLFV